MCPRSHKKLSDSAGIQAQATDSRAQAPEAQLSHTPCVHLLGEQAPFYPAWEVLQ